MTRYYICGVGDGVTYGVWKSKVDGSPVSKDDELISKHSSLKESMKAIRELEKNDKAK